MPRSGYLTELEKQTILGLQDENKSQNYISKKVGCHRRTVSRFLKKYDETVSSTPLPKGRPPRKMTKATDRILCRMSLKNRFKSRPELKEEVGVEISVGTIGRRLREFGVKKPMLTKGTMKKRLKFAKKYANWSEEDWSRVIFSDESKFLLHGSDGKRYVRRMKTEKLSQHCTIKTTKSKMGLMVWGCFSQRGLGYLNIITGTVNANSYIQILEDSLKPNYSLKTRTGSFNKTMCHATRPRRYHNTLIITVFLLSIGPETAPTLTPLKIYGQL